MTRRESPNSRRRKGQEAFVDPEVLASLVQERAALVDWAEAADFGDGAVIDTLEVVFPPGKRLHSYGKSPLFYKSTITGQFQ